uniref:Uncharacterized protein n=1 Tax=Rhizophora mucronata TaxID=61149 RepID=A0A2P2IRA0_RHIMU
MHELCFSHQSSYKQLFSSALYLLLFFLVLQLFPTSQIEHRCSIRSHNCRHPQVQAQSASPMLVLPIPYSCGFYMKSGKHPIRRNLALLSSAL